MMTTIITVIIITGKIVMIPTTVMVVIIHPPEVVSIIITIIIIPIVTASITAPYITVPTDIREPAFITVVHDADLAGTAVVIQAMAFIITAGSVMVLVGA
jgi:hypothetical protein